MKISQKFIIFLVLGNLSFLNFSLAAYKDLSPEEQVQAEKNYQRFQSLPAEKKELISDNWERYKALPAVEKEKIQDRYGKWQQLNPVQKNELLSKAKARAKVSAERRLAKKQDKISSLQLKKEARALHRRHRVNRCANGVCEGLGTAPNQ